MTERPTRPVRKTDQQILNDLMYLIPTYDKPAGRIDIEDEKRLRLQEAWQRHNENIRPYSDVEHSLGIKNFRREHLGLVQSLSSYVPINPHAEPLTDAATFNTRFSKIAHGMKVLYHAAADIAIRDRRYAETFFSGYTNPIITHNQQVDDLTRYDNLPAFATNGTLIEDVRDYYLFSIDSLSALELENVFAWVFINGKKINDDKYVIKNTAYGVKAFIAKDAMKNGDEVSVTVNRIFNPSKECIKHSFTADVNTFTKIFRGNELGNFYHHKYVKCYVKRNATVSELDSEETEKLRSGYLFGSLGSNSNAYKVASSFLEIPRDRVQTEVDNSGLNVKLTIRGFQFYQGDELFIMNSIHHWELHEEFSSQGEVMVNEFPLVEIVNNEVRPIPFGSLEDFDVFFDGYHLTAGEHYTVVRGGNGVVPFKLKLFLTPTANARHRVDIYKNEAIVDNDDLALVREEKVPDRGLLRATNNTSLPLMPRLGHCFVGGLYQPNKSMKSKFRRLMQIENYNYKFPVEDIYDTPIEYRCRVISTLDLNHVIAFMSDNLSEFDLVGEWIGIDGLIKSLYKNLPMVPQRRNALEGLAVARKNHNFPYLNDPVHLETCRQCNENIMSIGEGVDPSILEPCPDYQAAEKADNNDASVNMENTFKEFIKGKLIVSSATSSGVNELRKFIKYYHDNNIGRPLILDSNITITEHDVPMNLIGNMLVLDSNIPQSKALILDTNYLFQNPYENPMRPESVRRSR